MITSCWFSTVKRDMTCQFLLPNVKRRKYTRGSGIYRNFPSALVTLSTYLYMLEFKQIGPKVKIKEVFCYYICQNWTLVIGLLIWIQKYDPWLQSSVSNYAASFLMSSRNYNDEFCVDLNSVKTKMYWPTFLFRR